MIGETIGRYEILRKIGAGGMGEVYLARDAELDRQVAIKFLPPDFSANPQALERFRREARAAAALDHPNIITVHEFGDHEGRAYMVMTYVEGQPLSARIATGDLTVDQAVDLTLQICDGLGKAHQAGIVHRDVKPDNLVVNADGLVRILDFGLARQDEQTRLTRERSTVGTLHYMAPEQARGADVDGRADLFSVGAILYEMLTGQKAFRGEHTAAILNAIAHDDPPPIARFAPDAPPELERIVRKLLAKDPSVRYQTAADVMADLRALRTTSDETRAVDPPRRGARRPLAWVGVIAALVLLSVVFLSNPFRPDEPAANRGDRPMLVVLPFDNLGAADDEYFADGMTEEITSHLATVTGLGVISRSSAMRYKGTDLTLEDIADELGVDYVLEGSVRWDRSGGRELVRITPQLIRVADDTHVWADNYERELERIFEVQADIAAHITEAMEIALLDREREAIEAEPTQNTEAYTFYLRAREHVHGGSAFTTGQVQLALDMLRRAVELDPGFADAWGLLGSVQANLYHNGVDRTPERLEQARIAAERGLALDPDSPLTNLAMGMFHYWGLKDYETALEYTRRSIALRPGDAETIQSQGWILRRLGRYEEALGYLQEALALSPQDLGVLIGITEIHIYLRHPEPARRFVDRALALHPDDPAVYWYVETVRMLQGDLGDTGPAMPENLAGGETFRTFVAWRHYMANDEYEEALAALQGPGLATYTDEANYYPRSLLASLSHHALGDSAAARNTAQAALLEFDRELQKRPSDHRVYSSRGLALAVLGERERAIEAGRRSVALYPISRDRYGGVWRVQELSRIYGLLGEVDLTVDTLDQLLSIPSTVNVPSIRLESSYDMVRDAPAFQEMLRRHGGTS